MKKTLVFAAVAAFGMALNAASVSWGIANVKTPDESTLNSATGIMMSSANAASGYVALLYLTAQSSDWGKSVVVKETVISGIANKTGIDGNYVLSTSLNTNGGLVSVPTGYNGSNFSNGDSLTAFTVVFNVTDIANINDATAYMVTDEKTVSFTSSSGAKPFSFGSQANAQWHAIVPEPTSGLLMLVGLAGLALRRRRV